MEAPLAPVTGRRRFGAWTGGAVSASAIAVLVVLASRGDWVELARSMTAANPLMLGLGLALGLAVEVAKGTRWLLLLGLEGRALPRLLSLLLGSRILNAVTPVRAGDIWRVASVAASWDRPLPLAAGSVLAEKLLDGPALALAGLLLVGSTGLRIAGAGDAVLAGVALVVALFLALYAGRRGVARVHVRRWRESAAHLRDGRVLAGSLLLTLAGICLGALVNAAVLAALGLPADPAAAVAMLVGAYAVGLVPAGPGQIGVFELGVSAALMAAGMPAASAVATAVTLHLVLLAVLVVGGIVSLLLSTAGRAPGPVSQGESQPRRSRHGN